MSRRKRSTPETQQKTNNGITFQLSPGGMVGIGAVLLCLFLWMFLLGIWAGQTILYPPQPQMNTTASSPQEQADVPDVSPPLEILRPAEIKKRIAPPEPQ